MFLVFGIYDWFYFFKGPIAALMNEQSAPFLIGGGLILTFLIAYLLGSVNYALLISRLFYHDDVRTHGSGNAGTTNMLRTYGKKAAALTFLGDGLKGVLAIAVGSLIFAGVPGFLQTAAYLGMFGAVVGHIFPIFAHFNGGKGFATLAFSILALNPTIFVVIAAVFLTLVFSTRYVSLGSVVVALIYPVILSAFEFTLKPGLMENHMDLQTLLLPNGLAVLITIATGAMVVWAHRGNLKRISDRTERKLELGKKKSEEQV